MSGTRRAAVCLALLCALLAAPAAAEAHPSPSPMVDQINQIRVGLGLRALHYSPDLGRSSARYARYIMRTGRFVHAARIRASKRFVKLGEVLALTPSWEVNRTRTIIFWLLSESHRAVLLSPSFHYIGAAKEQGYLAGRPSTVWTVRVGRKRATGQPSG